jgi:hypothetical protein
LPVPRDAIDLWAAVRGLRPGLEAARDLAGEYNLRLSEPDFETTKRAEARRQKESEFKKKANAGHEALKRNPHVTEWWKTRGFSDELQKEFLLGSDVAGKSAVIPFWHQGRMQGLIRRQLDREPSTCYRTLRNSLAVTDLCSSRYSAVETPT